MPTRDLTEAFVDDATRTTYGPGEDVQVPDEVAEAIDGYYDQLGEAGDRSWRRAPLHPDDARRPTAPTDDVTIRTLEERDQRHALIGLYGPEIGRVLVGAGYQTREEVEEAPDDELLGVKGIGQASLKTIREREADGASADGEDG